MFQKTDSLRKKIIAACVVGLGILTIGPCAVETYHNFNRNKERYNLAKSKVQELAEYDHIPGTSSSEWRAVYNKLNINYEVRNPEKLSQENLEDYLGRFGFFWNGKEYSNGK
jgi:hypothetical protein